MALFNIGGVLFQVHPLNVHEVDHEMVADFAQHPVLGARKPFEYMGPGDDTMTLAGLVFPRQLGGEAELNLLQRLLDQGQPVLVMRGRVKLGWYILSEIRHGHRNLQSNGVGNTIEVSITLEKSPRPSGVSSANLLTRLFGYA